MKRYHYNPTPNSINSAGKQSGFSLIEVLITVLVLAVGSLGIASLQIAGLKYASGSYGRTQAIYLANDMYNRLKANRVASLDKQPDGSDGNPNLYTIPNFGLAVPAPAVDCVTSATGCNAAEQAIFDLDEWLTNVVTTLPSGSGTVIPTVIPAAGNRPRIIVYDIALQWRETATSTALDTNNDGVINDADNDSFIVGVGDTELKSFAFQVAL